MLVGLSINSKQVKSYPMKQLGVRIDNEIIIMNQRHVFNMYHIWLAIYALFSACLIFLYYVILIIPGWYSYNPWMLPLPRYFCLDYVTHSLTENREFTSHHLQIMIILIKQIGLWRKEAQGD